MLRRRTGRIPPHSYGDSQIIIMNRKKRPERKSVDFANKPFKTLKGFSAKSSPLKEPAQKPSALAAREEDDAALFLQAITNVKKLGAPTAARKRTRPSTLAEPRRDEEERKLFLEAVGTIGATFRGEAGARDEEGGRQRSPSSRMRQLKKGTIRIGEELDLHGHFKDEALAKLESFIAGAHARGRQAVLVITGKGINSPGGPVLQDAVSRWLREQGRARIAEFSPAPRDKGGSGAFVVFLKRK